jgi:nickel/cobalt transporter (NicO) family protein
MTSFTDLMQNGAAYGWLFVPSAILLGALHGLEPGHSKTMMAAFIVAIRGTISQAVLLALSATLSHTAIVWLIAVLALTYGAQWGLDANEPYFQLVSAAIIIGIALSMVYLTWRNQRAAKAAAHSHASSGCDFIKHQHGGHAHDQAHAAHGHDHDHDDRHAHAHPELDVTAADYADAHARAHAREIRERFTNRHVTTWQVALFGLTGGLIPCSAAVTVLLLCLQLQQFWLGMALVLCFGIGLALTLLASGVLAAWGLRHATNRWPWLDAAAQRAPYFSSAIVACVGLYMVYMAWTGLA